MHRKRLGNEMKAQPGREHLIWALRRQPSELTTRTAIERAGALFGLGRRDFLKRFREVFEPVRSRL